MESFAFFLVAENAPFLIAAVVMLSITALQIASLVLGLGLAEMLDGMMPELDADLDVDLDVDVDADVDLDLDADVDADSEVEVDSGSWLERAFGWLNLGRVPVIILLILFLTTFAVAGYVLQAFSAGLIGFLPAFVAGPVALVVALPATRNASRVIGRLLPKEETYAVSQGDFVGRTGKVTLGPVDRDNAGKAKLTDDFGNAHFVRVRAAQAPARFEVGDEVLLVERDGSLFEVIAPPNSLNFS